MDSIFADADGRVRIDTAEPPVEAKYKGRLRVNAMEPPSVYASKTAAVAAFVNGVPISAVGQICLSNDAGQVYPGPNGGFSLGADKRLANFDGAPAVIKAGVGMTASGALCTFGGAPADPRDALSQILLAGNTFADYIQNYGQYVPSFYLQGWNSARQAGGPGYGLLSPVGGGATDCYSLNNAGITGDLDVRVYCGRYNWAASVGTFQLLTGQTTGCKFGILNASPAVSDPVQGDMIATAPFPFTGSGLQWLRYTYVDNDGAGNCVYTFYSGTSETGPWTAIGAPIVKVGQRVKTGTWMFGAITASVGGNEFDGVIARVTLRAAIDNNKRFDADFAAQTQNTTRFNDSFGGYSLVVYPSSTVPVPVRIGSAADLYNQLSFKQPTKGASGEVVFSGTTYLATTKFPPQAAFTIYLVASQASFTSLASLVGIVDGAPNSGLSQALATGAIAPMVAGAIAPNSSPVTYGAGLHVFMLSMQAGAVRHSVDGGAAVANTLAATSMTRITLAGQGDGLGTSAMSAYELIVRNKVDSDTDKATIIGLLKQIYGVP